MSTPLPAREARFVLAAPPPVRALAISAGLVVVGVLWLAVAGTVAIVIRMQVPSPAELLRDEEAVLRRFPIGRPGEPADVAQAALYLASPASSWVTGVTITLDGGEMAARRRV